MNSPFRVSICGGGIGALALALVIRKYSKLPVDIFEAGPIITTIGAGIGFYARTMDIMKELGLYDEFVKLANVPPEENTDVTFRKSDQQDGYHWFSKNIKRGLMPIHRKDLIDFLLQQLHTSCNVYTSKKLTYYDVHPETGKITLHFLDGSRAVTDVLVGADGIHSATRRTMYQQLASSTRDDGSRRELLECIDPVWTGMMVYRGLIPTATFVKEYPEAETPTSVSFYLGRKKHFVTFPISHGELVNVVIVKHNPDAFGSQFEGRWVADVSEEEIRDQFEDWEIRAKALAKCVERPSRWAVHSVRPLPHYVDGKVALLGDAAHAMEFHFGAGAGQAIDDAYVLGRLLTHELTHQGNVVDALKIYEEVRLPFANRVAQESQNVGRYYGFQYASADSSVPAYGSPEELDYLRKSIEDAWEWQNEPSRVWDEAERRWDASCGIHAVL